MFRVNQLLLTRILFRILTSITFVLTLFFTGQIGDAAGYLGIQKFDFTGGSAELVRIIFSFITILKVYLYSIYNFNCYCKFIFIFNSK